MIPGNQTRSKGQQNVTTAQMEHIMFAQLKELFSSYGDLYEIWFDGGYLDRYVIGWHPSSGSDGVLSLSLSLSLPLLFSFCFYSVTFVPNERLILFVNVGMHGVGISVCVET